MLETCLRLTCLLNDLSAGRITAPEAERVLGPLHHVHDADEALGLGEPDPIASVPIRRPLARVAHSASPETLWGLYPVAPGRLAGLRGPAAVNQEAMVAGAAVVCHSSTPDGIPVGTAWIPTPVGPAVQWQIRRGAPPLPPPTAPEAGQQLRAVMARVAADLGRLDTVAGRRPEALAPTLGRGHRHSDQVLLDLAWTMFAAADAGLESASQMLTAHGSQVRETSLRRLRDAALGALAAASSWPRNS
ncbi:hypothetical protein [Acidipropionibacterium virtanenii]|uniref:Uncharacterized protein n=1 Tax=Acidipropionibacterium virtanenii TaxID=2057246 RepID=A0A344UT36_9ACTN|nr:hypothetical protein [Acidipropionibacterium virtanenii]AXE38434.1 hypothetical protein JS278_01258 [Acidipropionibacterium virtanenii]